MSVQPCGEVGSEGGKSPEAHGSASLAHTVGKRSTRDSNKIEGEGECPRLISDHHTGSMVHAHLCSHAYLKRRITGMPKGVKESVLAPGRSSPSLASDLLPHTLSPPSTKACQQLNRILQKGPSSNIAQDVK